MSDILEVHRHGGDAFELPLPTGWEWYENVEGCALVSREPIRDDEHLRATVVVTVERLTEGESLDAWAHRSVGALGEALHRHLLIDLGEVEIGGREGRRVLSHYVNREYGGVCVEQWLVPAGEFGYAVSCTTPALEYDDLFELMHAIAEGLRVR